MMEFDDQNKTTLKPANEFAIIDVTNAVPSKDDEWL